MRLYQGWWGRERRGISSHITNAGPVLGMTCLTACARRPQVKIQPVAKYDWEHKYYYGNLIAVSNAYLAYAIRGECEGAGGSGTGWEAGYPGFPKPNLFFTLHAI